jgi:hypothetical protein
MKLNLNHLNSQYKTYRYDEGQEGKFNLTVGALFEEMRRRRYETHGEGEPDYAL